MAYYQKTVSTVQTPREAYTEVRPRRYEQKKAVFRTYQVVWFILGLIETLLAFRVLFRMLGANPASGFVDFIYTLSYPFALPFINMFPTSSAGRSAIEWLTIVGMAIYLVIAWGIVKLLQFVKPTDPVEVERTVEKV